MAEIETVVENPYIGMSPAELVERLVDIKAISSELTRQVNANDSEKKLVEYALIQAHLADPAMTTVGTPRGTARFSPEDVYNVTNWDELFEYVKENNAFYLLMRRINQGPARELETTGQSLPLLDKFTRTKVSLSQPRKRA